MFCEDYFELKLPKRKLQELNERLTGCEYCNSTYDREDHETYFYEPHESFYDLLEDIGFTDEQKIIIYQNISCPNCGTEYEHSEEMVNRLKLAKNIDFITESKIWSYILSESDEDFLKPESLEEILNMID